MKYFIDTHDKSKGSFPAQELTEQQFFEQFAALEEELHQLRVAERAALATTDGTSASPRLARAA